MGEREKCGTCRFFRQSNVISVSSVCRRYPQPITHVQHDWCGEYTPKSENVDDVGRGMCPRCHGTRTILRYDRLTKEVAGRFACPDCTPENVKTPAD